MNLRTYLMIKTAEDAAPKKPGPTTFWQDPVGKSRVAARDFINAERGRALLGAGMLNGNRSLGTTLGAGAMIGGGGLAGAGLGAIGGLSAADALGLDADSDSYLARLGRYGLAGGGAALGGVGGAGLGAIGAGHLLSKGMSQKSLANAMRKLDRQEAKLMDAGGMSVRGMVGRRAQLAQDLGARIPNTNLQKGITDLEREISLANAHRHV